MTIQEEENKKGPRDRKTIANPPPGTSPQGARGRVRLSDRAMQVASQYAENAISPFALVAVVRIAEFAGIFLSSFIIYFLHVVPQDGFQSQYPLTALAAATLTVIGLQAADTYQITALRSSLLQLGKVLAVWTIVLALMTLTAFFLRISVEFSRVWLAAWYLTGIGFFILFRSAVAFMVRRWARNGRMERRAVIVGGGENAESLIRALEEQADNDIRICGIFDDRGGERSPPMVAGYPKLGTTEELVEFGRKARIDMLIVSLPMSAESRVVELLKKIWVLPVDIRLSAHNTKLRFRPRSYSYEGSVPFLDVFDKPIADWDAVMKRGFDIVFSLLGILIFSPLMIITAIAIKIESGGPVLFRQKRFGFNNEVIDVLKFRSMFAHLTDKEAKKSVTRNDPRVTKVGRFIRRTSLDELPQFFNVLRGELSLVGPRPHAVNAHTQDKLWDELVDGYFGRHKVKPGVTGWAQINGWRGEVDTENKIQTRVEYDLYYIENWSILFDLYILMLTPLKLFDTDNAY